MSKGQIGSSRGSEARGLGPGLPHVSYRSRGTADWSGTGLISCAEQIIISLNNKTYIFGKKETEIVKSLNKIHR